MISLGALCARLSHGEFPKQTVCLTVDDGYRDFHTIGAPILSEFGSATVFVTSRLIDGDFWCWWDRIEYIFDHTRRDRASLAVGDGPECFFAWDSEQDRNAAREAFTDACKEIPDEAKWAAIHSLEQILGVEVPSRPPEKYRGMTWEDVRRLQKQGFEFGGHTVTHPILSRMAPEQAEWEVVESLRAIERNTGVKPTTFAYPNGRECDFSNHVIEVLKREGVVGAVTGEWGVVSKGKLAALRDPLYRLPRVGMPTTVDGFLQAIRGAEALKQALGYV